MRHAFNCSMFHAHVKLYSFINAHVMLFTQPLKLLLAMLNTDVWHSHFTVCTHSRKHISLKRLVRRKRAILKQMKPLIMIIFNLNFWSVWSDWRKWNSCSNHSRWKYFYKENRLVYLPPDDSPPAYNAPITKCIDGFCPFTNKLPTPLSSIQLDNRQWQQIENYIFRTRTTTEHQPPFDYWMRPSRDWPNKERWRLPSLRHSIPIGRFRFVVHVGT